MAKRIVERKNRRSWFEKFKNIMTGRYKKPQLIYMGEKIKDGSIVISNHEGTDGPMTLELYLDAPIRFWGAHEMNSGLVKLYKYQTNIYYHQKKHWIYIWHVCFALLPARLPIFFTRDST
ncbi:MAG: hypothetical protein E7596_02605 [Ruminococcaceae bacterium]|nr:hypothetical protein [Oscillospiraceae bacterium]